MNLSRIWWRIPLYVCLFGALDATFGGYVDGSVGYYAWIENVVRDTLGSPYIAVVSLFLLVGAGCGFMLAIVDICRTIIRWVNNGR